VKRRVTQNPGSLSMQELFRVEAENQTTVLTSGLLALERTAATVEQLERLMRAAHSLKGAARIVNLSPAVQVAHAMEDCFVAAQQDRIELGQPHIDVLLRGVDWLTEISKQDEASVAAWQGKRGPEMELWLQAIHALTPVQNSLVPAGVEVQPAPEAGLVKPPDSLPAPAPKTEEADRFLRLTAENLRWRASRWLNRAGCGLLPSLCSGSSGCSRTWSVPSTTSARPPGPSPFPSPCMPS
jgi:two-component system sensor histidine kinase and response regulator WspE